MWNCQAVSSMLYGIESVIVSDETIEKLETIQATFGKGVLNVRQSTANIFPIGELGLKTMRHRIYGRKIKFFDYVKKLSASRLAKKALQENLSEEWQSDYIDHISSIEREVGILIAEDRLKVLDDWGKTHIRDQIKCKKSLDCMPFPGKGWKKSNYVNDTNESAVLAEFRGGNAKLGNKDSDMAGCVPNHVNGYGQVDFCPACEEAEVSEQHVVIDCSSLVWERGNCYKVKKQSLQEYIDDKKKQNNDSKLILRMLLGGDGSDRKELITRAKMLEELRLTYFEKWEDIELSLIHI